MANTGDMYNRQAERMLQQQRWLEAERMNLSVTPPFLRDRSSLIDTIPVNMAAQQPSADLQRQAVGVMETTDDLRADLALRSESLLGYAPLRKDMNLPGRLARVLAELGIEPFTKEAVDKYKAEMVEWRRSELTKQVMKEDAEARLKSRRVSSYDPGPMMGLGVVARGMMIAREEVIPTRTIEVYWNKFNLSGYTKPVPEFALMDACSIKERLPVVVFKVDELVEKINARVLPDPEPFLIASLGDEEFHIHVWEEPGFEKDLPHFNL